MSLPAQNVAPQAVAAAGQTVFPFAWRCDDSTLVVVWVNNAQDGGFTVQLNADQTASPGGTITRGVACVGGEVVTVERTSPQTQAVDLVRYGAFAASTITNSLDKILMLSQETAAILGRCFRGARSQLSKIGSLELPAPVLNALLQWQDAGGGLFKLGNIDVAQVLAIGVGRIEATGEAVNRTGVGTYQLAHVPVPLSKVKLYLNGARIMLNTHYTISVAGLITQLAGFISDPAEVLLADYTW